MPRLKLTLEYDGARYAGWQSQTNGLAIQDVVAKGLKSFLGTEVKIEAASRTDAGVHAFGQVISFDTDRQLPMKAYRMGLTDALPHDIAVVEAQEVALDFDPRRNSRGKRYLYRIYNGGHRSPLRRRSHWELFPLLNFDAMALEAPHLIGQHDFTAFRASDCQARHAVRTLCSVEVTSPSTGEIHISVHGTAFLKHMVRNIAGTLVEMGKGKRPAGWVREVLQGRDRTVAGPTAPAHGLTLVEVIYGESGNA